jgi:hypothetical protein
MGGDCGELEWSPIASAPVHSAFAGVLAGLVFAGIVVLLSGTGDQVRRTNALVTFGSSFLVLAFDAFLFGVVAGERVCGRAWTETLYASGLLGLGALGIFAGICWLIDAGDTTSGRMTRFYVVTTYVIALIVSYHIGSTASEYLNDVRLTSGAPGWLVTVTAAYRWIMLAAVLLTGASLRFRRRWSTSRPVVTSAAYAYVACVVLALYGSGSVSGDAQDWTHPSAALVAGNTSVALMFPALAVLAQVITLPSRTPTVTDT